MKRYIVFIYYFLIFYALKPIACFFRLFKKENIYLFIERGFEAQDNSYFLFNYYKKIKSKSYFIIDKKSADCTKIEKKKMIKFKSLKHMFFLSYCDYIFTTHICSYIPGNYSEDRKNRMFKIKAIKIWLQHGITKNHHPELTYPNLNVDLFICGSKEEYEFILEKYKYPTKCLKYTGFPRFDNLPFKNEEGKIKKILIMPTWRKYLNQTNFADSQYFYEFSSLLSNQKLLSYCRQNEIEIKFYLHFELQKYSSYFACFSNDVVEICFSNDSSVQNLLIESDFLITDYSSVFFDFAFMNKPMCYFQFDEKEYFSKHYFKGYFDYRRDGFGPVMNTNADVVDYIVSSLMKNDNFEFESNINKAFFIHDHKNCKRIFETVSSYNKKEILDD